MIMEAKFKPGDICYFVSGKKILKCEIVSSFIENDELFYQIRDLINYRYTFVDSHSIDTSEDRLRQKIK